MENLVIATFAYVIILIIELIIRIIAPSKSCIMYGGNNYRQTDSIDELVSFIKSQLTETLKESVDLEQEFKKMEEKNQPAVITYDDITGSMPYVESQKVLRPNVHIGQRKLFLSEVQFLNDIKEQAHIVYAGAAPSNKTGLLANLFPNVKFLLVDPNPFDIHGWKNPKYIKSDELHLLKTLNDRIIIINDYFTVDMAKELNKIYPKTYFISDIRTNSNPDKDGPPLTLDILWNMAQQYNWIRALKPELSMLKFRHPFYTEDIEETLKLMQNEPYNTDFEMAKNDGLDFAANLPSKELFYFDGKLNLQAFPGESSTETRLITDGKKVVQLCSQKEYEDKLFWYNNISRPYIHHYNNNANQRIGFDHCNDCAIENHIWNEYVKFRRDFLKLPAKPVLDYVKSLSQIIYRNLFREPHGFSFNRKMFAAKLETWRKKMPKDENGNYIKIKRKYVPGKH